MYILPKNLILHYKCIHSRSQQLIFLKQLLIMPQQIFIMFEQFFVFTSDFFILFDDNRLLAIKILNNLFVLFKQI